MAMVRLKTGHRALFWLNHFSRLRKLLLYFPSLGSSDGFVDWQYAVEILLIFDLDSAISDPRQNETIQTHAGFEFRLEAETACS